MDKQTTQALNSLIPTLTGPMPPQLLELSASLVAQSRSKASSLKAEEEIARSYACANIACERLKQNLSLPKIEPRPPCPPKIYQKLYKYLEGVLPTGMKRSSRPSRVVPTNSTSASAHVRPDQPARPINSRRRTAPRTTTDPESPPWIMPVIRDMCRKLNAPATPHHIFAGVSSILSSDNGPANINVPALTVILYILVLTRLTGVETEPAEYLRRKEIGLAALQEAMAKRNVELDCDQTDIDDCMRQVSKYRWTDMDWFRNVDVGSGLGGEDDEEEDVDDDDGDEKGPIFPVQSEGLNGMEEEDYLQAGLGTMMDDRVDYLSLERRRSYQRWKTEKLLQIDELEAQQQEMVVDNV